MSTAVNPLLEDNSAYIEDDKGGNSYLYGKSGTDESSIENNKPEIRPRSKRKNILVSYVNNKVEDIKQIWNGTVISCNDEELTARLEDSTDPSKPDEMVVLSLEEIENKDKPLIKIGAMFLWHIGYRYGPKYPRERFSIIRFRRLPKWTEEEVKDAEKLAKEYADFFLADQTNTT